MDVPTFAWRLLRFFLLILVVVTEVAESEPPFFSMIPASFALVMVCTHCCFPHLGFQNTLHWRESLLWMALVVIVFAATVRSVEAIVLYSLCLLLDMIGLFITCVCTHATSDWSHEQNIDPGYLVENDPVLYECIYGKQPGVP